MKIPEVYKKYSITPLLQLHQLRAAAVGKCITDNWKNEKLIDKQAVIETLLLHDMGNIIKFDLENSPKLLGDEFVHIDFWKQKQKEFIKKYGTDEHKATHQIGKEIGVSPVVDNLLSQLGGNGLAIATEGNDFSLKICFYCDLRCGPFGILSVNERFDDLLARYKGRNHPVANVQITEGNRKNTLEIEKQLQEHVIINLKKDISDDSIAANIEELKNYEIK